MAIYHVKVSTISRSRGRSVMASAAYRSGERLVRDHAPDLAASAAYRSGEAITGTSGDTFDYRRREAGVTHTEIMAPEGTPDWLVADRQTLYSCIDRTERRSDSVLAREVLVALPVELSHEQRVELVRDFANAELVSRGMIVDACHHIDRDGTNPHAHLLCTTRKVDESKPFGFGPKVREWDHKALVYGIRQSWERCANHALEMAGAEARIDGRSIAARLEAALEAGDFAEAARWDREPQIHVGPDVQHASAKSATLADKQEAWAEIAERNAARAEVYAAVLEHASDLPDAQVRFLEMRAASADPISAFEAWGSWAHEQLEHLRELALGAVEHVRDFAVSAVEHVADWFSGLAQVDDAGLREAREEVERHEQRAQEQELAEIVHQLDAREQEREAVREAVREQELERVHERSHGLELGM